MKYPLRNPKSEMKASADAGFHGADDCSWGNDSTDEPLVLREDSSKEDTQPPNLHERAAQFGEAIIEFAKEIPQNPVNDPLISQLVGAGMQFRISDFVRAA